MSDINPTILREVAARIREAVEVFGIPVEAFTIKISINADYYNTIKGNFPNHPYIEMVISLAESDWAIDLIPSKKAISHLE